MTKSINPKNFLKSVRSKLHRSKGHVPFASRGRIFSDWHLLLGIYFLANVIIMGYSFYNIQQIKNGSLTKLDEEMSFRGAGIFSEKDLDLMVEYLNNKAIDQQSIERGLTPLPQY